MSDKRDEILAVFENVRAKQDQTLDLAERSNERLSNIERTLLVLRDTLVARLAQLTEELNAARAAILARVDSLTERLDKTRVDLMDRMDRLQDALENQRESTTVNFGAAERAERIAQSARDETRLLTEQVTSLTRLVRRLENEIRVLRDQRDAP